MNVREIPVVMSLAAALGFGCAESNEEVVARSGDELTGGSRASAYAHRYVGFLKEKRDQTCSSDGSSPDRCTFRIEDAPYCSGTLIAPGVVLTAAHCVEGRTARWSVFGLGAADASYGEIRSSAAHPVHAIREIVVHPLYLAGQTFERDRPFDHDVALLFLTLEYPPGQPVASLEGPAPEDACDLTAIGYGRNGSRDYTGERRTSTVCAEQALDARPPYYVARSPDASICFGDSGSPLLVQGTSRVLGVMSTVYNACKQDALGLPGMYLSIASQRAFIDCALSEKRGACRQL